MPKQLINGKEYNVREESFEIIRQDWAEFRLESGVRLRVKPEVVKIFRILDEKGQPAFTEQGDPFVMVRGQMVLAASEKPGTH